MHAISPCNLSKQHNIDFKNYPFPKIAACVKDLSKHYLREDIQKDADALKLDEKSPETIASSIEILESLLLEDDHVIYCESKFEEMLADFGGGIILRALEKNFAKEDQMAAILFPLHMRSCIEFDKTISEELRQSADYPNAMARMALIMNNSKISNVLSGLFSCDLKIIK